VAKDIHSKAAAFIKWLKEAEEDSSEEDDGEGSDGEDVEVRLFHWHMTVYIKLV